MNFKITTLHRKSVFETNSSSCHSLALKKTDTDSFKQMCANYIMDKDGVLNFTTENHDNQVGLLKSFDEKLAYVMTLCLYKDDYGAFMNVVEAIHDVTQFQVLSYDGERVGTWNDKQNCFQFDNNENFEAWDNLIEKAILNEAYIDSESSDLLDELVCKKHKLKHLLFADGSEICVAYDNDSCLNIAGGYHQEVQNQVKNLLNLIIKYNPDIINHENLEKKIQAFIQFFGDANIANLMVDLDALYRSRKDYSIKSALLDMVDNEYYFIESVLLKAFEFVEILVNKNHNPVHTKLNEMKKSIGKGSPPKQFKDKLYSLFKEYVLEIKQKNPVISSFTELEQTVYELDFDFDNMTFEELTDEQHDCYMMVYKNKINNASVVLDYLLFEHLTMPELHEWIKLFNYHYG